MKTHAVVETMPRASMLLISYDTLTNVLTTLHGLVTLMHAVTGHRACVSTSVCEDATCLPACCGMPVPTDAMLIARSYDSHCFLTIL